MSETVSALENESVPSFERTNSIEEAKPIEVVVMPADLSESSKTIETAKNDQPQKIQRSYHKKYPYFLVFNATLGSLYFGYVASSFNPIHHFISSYAFGEELSPMVLNFMTSFVLLGGGLGAVLAGKIASLIGRRTSMILVDCLSIIGTALTLLPSQYFLIVGRLLQGYTAGANSSLVPLYIKEVAPLEIAGRLGTCNQLFLSSGVLLAPIIGLGMPTGPNINPESQYYRIVLAVAGIFPLMRLLFSFTVFNFETPKYLISKNKEKEALTVLSKVYSKTRAHDELALLRTEKEILNRNGKISVKEIFSCKYRRRLFVGVMMAVFQQFSGISIIIFFSNKIFSQGADPNSHTPTIYTIIMDVIQVITNIIAGFIIERFGRKLLSLLGMAFVTVVLGAFGIVCLFVSTSPALKFFIWGYMIGYGLSVGPLPWVIISDILPDVAIGIAILTMWLSAFAIGLGFPQIMDSLGIAWCFIIFSVCSLVGTLFISYFVKETKGKNDAEIAALYSSKKSRNSY